MAVGSGSAESSRGRLCFADLDALLDTEAVCQRGGDDESVFDVDPLSDQELRTSVPLSNVAVAGGDRPVAIHLYYYSFYFGWLSSSESVDCLVRAQLHFILLKWINFHHNNIYLLLRQLIRLPAQIKIA